MGLRWRYPKLVRIYHAEIISHMCNNARGNILNLSSQWNNVVLFVSCLKSIGQSSKETTMRVLISYQLSPIQNCIRVCLKEISCHSTWIAQVLIISSTQILEDTSSQYVLKRWHIRYKLCNNVHFIWYIYMKSCDIQNLWFTKTMIIILVDILLHRHKGQHS